LDSGLKSKTKELEPELKRKLKTKELDPELKRNMKNPGFYNKGNRKSMVSGKHKKNTNSQFFALGDGEQFESEKIF
jgi:hypothetical protein